MPLHWGQNWDSQAPPEQRIPGEIPELCFHLRGPMHAPTSEHRPQHRGHLTRGAGKQKVQLQVGGEGGGEGGCTAQTAATAGLLCSNEPNSHGRAHRGSQGLCTCPPLLPAALMAVTRPPVQAAGTSPGAVVIHAADAAVADAAVMRPWRAVRLTAVTHRPVLIALGSREENS